MRLLLDTHVLIWAAGNIDILPRHIRSIMEDEQNELLFSPASIWETAIKQARNRTDFQIDPLLLRYHLLQNGYVELPINSDHAITIARLPQIHKDPFDRILIAQAITENVPLATVDKQVLQYPGLMSF